MSTMRVTTSKSKNSESFYINFAYIDENGKSTSKTYRKLGTLKELSEKLNTDREGVMAWAKEQARLATIEYNQENEALNIPFAPNQLIEKNQQRHFNCGYLFIQSILSSLRLENMFRTIKRRNQYDYNLQAIFHDLIYARFLHPSSKKSSYEFAQTLLETPKYQLQHVYRALSVLAKESDFIQAELYKNSNFVQKRDNTILYYDCSNYYFEIEQEDGLKKYGKSKEHRPNPIVGMGLFMDAQGVPLAFDLYPGNQNEQKTLKPLEQKIIRDFEMSEFIYCSDSGLGSTDNKKFNSFGGRSYVITQSLKKLKQEDRDIALNPTQYRLLGSDTFIDLTTLDKTDPKVFNAIYYKEIPLKSITKDRDETLIVTYSPKYANYQAKIRNQQIERALKIIESGQKSKKNRKNPQDPHRFIRTIQTTQEGEVADVTNMDLDIETIEKEKMYDGFYGVVTNLEDRAATVIQINHQRWKIEECFRTMKTDFMARPVYLQREDRIKAHFLICFISLVVYRLLEGKLEQKYTIGETLKTLKNMEVCKIEGCGYIPTYTRTEITDTLHKLFGFRTDTEIIKKEKMRSLIKQSKTK